MDEMARSVMLPLTGDAEPGVDLEQVFKERPALSLIGRRQLGHRTRRRVHIEQPLQLNNDTAAHQPISQHYCRLNDAQNTLQCRLIDAQNTLQCRLIDARRTERNEETERNVLNIQTTSATNRNK